MPRRDVEMSLQRHRGRPTLHGQTRGAHGVRRHTPSFFSFFINILEIASDFGDFHRAKRTLLRKHSENNNLEDFPVDVQVREEDDVQDRVPRRVQQRVERSHVRP